MAYPNSYDVASAIFTNVKNIVSFVLSAGITNVATSISVSNANGMSGAQNFYAAFNDGGGGQPEIVKVTNITGTTLTVVRGQEGTSAVAHLTGAKLVLEPTKAMYSALRTAIETIQKYSAALIDPATVTEVGGELMQFGGQLYIGLPAEAGGGARRITYQSHQDLTGRDIDSHTQYLTDARMVTAHDALGSHLTAVAHDHSANSAAKKFRYGTYASMPASPSAPGEVYFATDRGSLYFAAGAGPYTWEQYVTMATGTMLFFETSCPPGWSQVTAYNGKFLRGAPAGVWTTGTGGSSTHTHTLPDLINHTHTVPAIAGNLSTDGGHSHSAESSSDSGYSSGPFETTAFNSTISTSDAGDHYHTLSVPAQDSNEAGSASPTTNTANNLPPNAMLLICKKN